MVRGTVPAPARRANHFGLAESCQARVQKIFRFSELANQAISSPARAAMRDVCAIVTERGAGCDGRLLRQRGGSRAGENAAAYGEVVWSWRRDPGVYPSRPCGNGNGGNKGRSPGRARSKP